MTAANGLGRGWCLAVLVLGALALGGGAQAGQVQAAIAANFASAAESLGAAFTAATGHRVVLSFGSTGQLYAQIAKGAPFAVYLAADQARPRQAVEAGLAVAGTRFTYAIGRLVLYGTDPALVIGEETLRRARFDRLAIANPRTAPYGAAAIEVLGALGVADRLRARLVYGINVAQAHQFVETGNAELGLVAWSQVVGHDRGSRWLVPEALHGPIAQDAVLLSSAVDDAPAKAFLGFVGGPEGRAVIERHGYRAGR